MKTVFSHSLHKPNINDLAVAYAMNAHLAILLVLLQFLFIDILLIIYLKNKKTEIENTSNCPFILV